MKEILEAWLENTLGFIVNLDSITQVLKDGMIFIRILKRYNAANVNAIKNCFPSDDDDVCKNNLTQLRIWFTLLDIDFSDEIINEIIKGNPKLCINILYKLYVIFEQRSTFAYITKQKVRCVKNRNDKFTVTKLSSSDVGEKGYERHNRYAEKFHQHKALIDWYETKYDKKKKWVCQKSVKNQLLIDSPHEGSSSEYFLKESPKKIKSPETKRTCRRSEDINYVRNEIKCKLDSDASSEEFSEHCYETVTSKFLKSDPSDSYFEICKQSNVLPPISPNEYHLPQTVKEYMRKLKSSVGFSCKRHFKTFCTLPIKKVWDDIEDRENAELENMIIYRILKQSVYEKELSAKFASIRKQHKVQKASYIDLETQIMKSRKSALFPSLSPEEPSLDVVKSSCENVHNDDDDDCGDDELDSSYLDTSSHRYMNDSFTSYSRNEKKRTVELHRRLYAEKLKLQFDRHYAICLHALEDMIELGIRKSEFKSKYSLDVPSFMWSDWKCLLHHNQPIHEFIEDLDVILYPDLDNMDFVAAVVRQDMLSENNLDMYIHVKDDWDVYNLEVEGPLEAESDNMMSFTFDHDSQIPLGYVVHRVLEKKYPSPPQIKPANISKFPVMAIVNGIDSINAIEKLKNILQRANILVVDANTAVNFCLQSFKDTYNMNNVGNFNDVRYEVPSVTLTSTDIPEKVTTNAFKEQFTQTGSSVFNLEDNFSHATSSLGCDIFNMMVFGNELPFNMIVDSIIQFIKHKEHEIKGWVLVNTPSTMYQASVLEYILTGRKFPFHMEDDLNSSSESECKISQTGQETILDNAYYSEVKSSKIVPNPSIINNDGVFKTYFTMYVTMVKGHSISNSNYTNGMEEQWDGRSDSTMLLEQPEKEGIPTLHNFYHDQGVGYDFIYEQLDSNALKQLGRVILLNYLEDSKVLNWVEDLFSEELLHEFEPSVIVTWKNPARNYVNESSLFGPKKSQNSNVDVEKSKLFGDEISEANWQFSDYPIPDNILRALASFWEATENVYLNVLKDAFFVKRSNDYTALPYTLHLKQQFNLLFEKEDDRQNVVTDFLNAYNSINQVLRSNSDMKNELHLRVVELKVRLTYLCQEKCEKMEEMRLALINQNWAYHVMALYTNCFISLVQLELDRCTRTLAFLQDYYRAMLQMYDSEPIPNIKISKIDVYSGEVEEETSDYEVNDNEGNSEEEEEEEEEKVTKTGNGKKRIIINLNVDEIDDDLYKSVINRITNYTEAKNSVTPFYDVFCNKTNDCFLEVLKIKSQIDNVIAKDQSTAFKKVKDQLSVKQSVSKDGNTNQKSKKNKLQSPVDNSDQMKDLNEKDSYDVKEVLLKSMFEEWKFAIKSEIDRLFSRIELLKKKLKLDYNFIENLIGSKFTEINELIYVRFLEEEVCIDKLCNLFQVAIEDKTCINADLIFKHNTFYVIKHPVETPAPTIKLPISLEEFLQEEYFTIKQLEVIQERLMKIAPSGIITREAFVSFIQNIICNSSNHDNVKLVPALWNKLQHNDLQLLFQKIFGKYSIIEWRDFLIHCLELPFPITEDIIDAKLQLARYDLEDRELVTYDAFMKTTLWFQRELPENPSIALRNILSKEYLFTLFRTSDDMLNYTSFLLTFCRDIDPKVGFGKTLSLLMGKCVIVYEEDLYLEEMMSDHVDIEFKVVQSLLDDIINDVVCNSLFGKRDSLTDFVDRSLLEKRETRMIDNTNNDNDTTVLSENMYYQFFRRFSTLQWISKVPSTLITTVLCITYYPLFKPENFVLYPDICTEIYQFMLNSCDEDVFVPTFVDNWWIEEMFDQVSKFTAYSLKDVVKELNQ